MFAWVAKNCSRRVRSRSCISRNSTPNSSSRITDCGGLNGDGNRLFRSLEVRCQETTVLDCKIAHALTATHADVVYDPYPSMVARKYSWEFYLIANMLPLFSHSAAFRRDVFQQRPLR